MLAKWKDSHARFSAGKVVFPAVLWMWTLTTSTPAEEGAMKLLLPCLTIMTFLGAVIPSHYSFYLNDITCLPTVWNCSFPQQCLKFTLAHFIVFVCAHSTSYIQGMNEDNWYLLMQLYSIRLCTHSSYLNCLIKVTWNAPILLFSISLLTSS